MLKLVEHGLDRQATIMRAYILETTMKWTGKIYNVYCSVDLQIFQDT